MANLFWKSKEATTRLVETPFRTEEEFERLIFATPEILEDIFLLKRQIRGGTKQGIPDIVGLDKDGNICIIEMKNVTVDASIIPQVLQYAFWAETNPDSIKSLWLEVEAKPDDLSVSWDDFEVRIIVIAPTILRSTLDIVNKINYPVDLIEVKRWVETGNSFLLVNRLELEQPKRLARPVSGLEVYDADFYLRAGRNKTSVTEFIRYAKDTEDLVRKKGWHLETKFNKHYCSFKAGFFNAFGVQWIGTKTFAMFVKLPESEASATGPKMTRYETQWKQALYYIEPGRTKVADFVLLFEKAYRRLTGE
ncbi:MAG TPA: hypothetical protein VGC60_19260 [Pyrinomonadaceae bacterium]|jgi:hypothetical protein